MNETPTSGGNNPPENQNPAQGPAEQSQPSPPQQPPSTGQLPPYPQPGQPYPPQAPKSKTGLIAGITIGVLVLALMAAGGLVATIVVLNKDNKKLTDQQSQQQTTPSTDAPAKTPSTDSTGSASFDVPLGPDGQSDPEDWPDACTMLTDAEIKAIVPGVTRIGRKGQHGGFLGGGETPHYVECSHEISRPTDAYDLPSKIIVILRDVAAPNAIKKQYEQHRQSQERISEKYPDQYRNYGPQFGADDCYSSGSSLECHTGKFLFQVAGNPATQENEDDPRHAREEWQEETLTAVARTLSAKMR